MITTANSKDRYVGNNSASAFTLNCRIIRDTHVEVIRANTDDTDQELLVLNTDYTVSGVGNSTATITLTGGVLASGKVLSLRRTVPKVQLTEFANQGGFFPKTHEDTHDYTMMCIIELAEEISRCPKTSITSGLSGDSFTTVLGNAVSTCTLAAASVQPIIDLAPYALDLVVKTYEATATAGQTTIDISAEDYDLPSSLDNVALYIDGVKQAKSSLTLTTSTLLTLGGALVGGEKIEMKLGVFEASATSDAVASAGLAAAARDAAVVAQAAAEAAQAAAELAASSISLPNPSGHGEEIARANASGTALEYSGKTFSTDGTMAGDSDALIPTEKAVKAYVSATGYVARTGVGAEDFGIGAGITKDGAFHDLDLSSIVPAGAKAIHARVRMRMPSGATANTQYSSFFRKNGAVGTFDFMRCSTVFAQATLGSACDEYYEGIVPCDSNRVIEVMVENTAASIQCALTVGGWFV